MHRFGVAILVIGLACGAAWSPSGLGQLPAEIRNMMGDRKLPDDALGAIVVRLTDGKIVFCPRRGQNIPTGINVKSVDRHRWP